jgi:hypothetical protein
MRRLTIGLALAGAAILGACNDAGKVFLADNGPVAYVRFVNAIPDSGGQDWRFVDAVEGSPTVINMRFRGIFPGTSYQSASAGRRHLRIFQSATDPTFTDPLQATPALVSTVFIDSAFTLVAGTHYTIMAVGNLRAPRTAKLVILTDDYGDPAAGIAVRTVNTGVTGSIDVYGSTSGGTTALPSTPLVATLASYAASPWVSMSTGALTLRANSAGSRTLPAMIDAIAPAGVAANRGMNLTAIGGSTIAGTAFTAFIFPPAVTGSSAAAVGAGTCPTRCTTAGVVYAVDRYPPSGF